MTGITNLPEEVLVLIGTHLDNKNIMAAIQTCRLLHNTLCHLLWRQLNLPLRNGELLLSAAKLKENAHKVHCLTYHHPPPQEHCSIRFPNVYYLKFDYNSGKICRVRSSRAIPEHDDRDHCLLIKSNPQVRDLTIRNLKSPPSVSFWDTVITYLRRPRRLEFRCFTNIPKDSLESFWRACSLFEELDLKLGDSSYRDILMTRPSLRLRRLSLEVGDCQPPSNTWNFDLKDCLLWIRNAASLEALVVHVYRRHKFPTDVFIEELSKKAWPHLESVRLKNVSESDDVWANIIQLLPPLKVFQIISRLFEEQGLARLQEYHFKTLRNLNVRGCPLFSSRMVLSVLTGCVHLEEFRAPYLYAVDLKSGASSSQDWVCVGLKCLRLHIAGEPNDPESNELVFKQLSRLHQLRQLNLDQLLMFYLPTELIDHLTKKGSLQVRLDTGLGHLSTLRQLATISFDNTHQNMRVEEVEWILENWTSLEEISGPLTDDLDTQAELYKMIRQSGVSYEPGSAYGLFGQD
ncbi:hypothetical protein EC991_004498 [Linnemannia zychae]|nr:hypothetical protein EC991_004498 [Linnemannia zychae]